MNTPLVKKLVSAISFLLICASDSVNASDLPCTPNTQISLPAIHADVIAIGEVHGSNEIPVFVGGLVCQLALSGKPVVLGLELPMDLQAAITKYTLSKGEPEEKKALLSSDFWQEKNPDGRTSAAMFKLIDLVRRLRSEGKEVLLSAFDSRRSDEIEALSKNEPRTPARRDSIMATNIYDRVKQYSGHTHIVLAGNGHIGKFKQQDWNPVVSSMGYLLQQRLSVYSISFSFLRDGEIWACRGPDVPCGLGPVTASNASTKEGFDLIVPIEQLTASIPAKDAP